MEIISKETDGDRTEGQLSRFLDTSVVVRWMALRCVEGCSRGEKSFASAFL